MDVTEAEWGLLRTATGFSVDGHESREGFSLATHELGRSSTLQTAFESSEEGSRVPVRLTHSQLAQWCAYVRGKGSEGEPTTVELQQILQAAEYLDDHATIIQASEDLARLLFPASPTPGKDPAPLRTEGSAAAGGVMEALQEHLAITTLRAALAAVPLRVNRRSANGEVFYARARARRLCAVLALLPEPLRPLALRAADPAVDSNRSLTLHDVDARAAAAVMRCAAAGLSAHLTALSLSAAAPQHRRRSLEDATAVLGRMVAPLPQLEGLQRLNFCLEDHHDRRVCIHSVAAVLPSLSRLTHLKLSGTRAGAVGLQGLAQSLPALGKLRTLELSDGVLGAYRPGALPQLKALATALRTLRKLTRLSLANTLLREGCWKILAPAVAALPLQSLDLQKCRLKDNFDLFSGCDREPARPFPALQELDLSSNFCINFRCGVLARLPGLKRVSMTRMPLCPEVEEQVLQALLDNPSADMEVLKLAYGGAETSATCALSRGLMRWARLHTVALMWHSSHNRAAIPRLAPLLAALPQLRDLCLGFASVQSREDAPEALSQMQALTSLELSYLQCSVIGAPELARRTAALTRLRSLRVQFDNVQKPESGSVNVIVGSLAALTLLTYLSLQEFALMDDGSEMLARCLRCMPSMHELHLPVNLIGPAGAQVLAGVLPTLYMLSVLNLRMNRLGDEGVEALAGVLPRMHALRHLQVGHCGVGDAGEAAVLGGAGAGMQSISL